MIRKQKKEKLPVVLPSLKKPDADPDDLKVQDISKEEEDDAIPEEDPFETPPYEPPMPGEGP
jgi:hypothetical protein